MPNEKLRNVHEIHIKRTAYDAAVADLRIRLTKITKKTRDAINCRNRKIYMRTRAIKHLYDKRPAEEFDFLLDHLYLVIRNPDRLYKNKNNKTADFCILKKIADYHYLAAIQVISEKVEIVTAFRIKDQKYLRNYELLRSWRDGAHSS